MSDGLISLASDAILSFLFPQACHECGDVVLKRAYGVACSACWTSQAVTPLFRDLEVCDRCGAPGSGVCVVCAPDRIAAARSVGEFAGALRANLLEMKRRPVVCDRLTEHVSETYRRESVLHGTDIIVPVPLHPERIRERGHNQAETLARAFARSMVGTVEPAALARVRTGARRRAAAGRSARAESVRGAFRASRGIAEGARVLLIDDLYTTGATAGACADALLAAGAVSVCVLTAGRVLRN